MLDGYSNIGQTQSKDELETAAAAGAAAIQSLIADRNNLRNQLAASRAVEEELRERMSKLHQRYPELAKRVVAELQEFDSTILDSVRGRPEVNNDDGTNIPPSLNHFSASGLPVNGIGHRNGGLSI